MINNVNNYTGKDFFVDYLQSNGVNISSEKEEELKNLFDNIEEWTDENGQSTFTVDEFAGAFGEIIPKDSEEYNVLIEALSYVANLDNDNSTLSFDDFSLDANELRSYIPEESVNEETEAAASIEPKADRFKLWQYTRVAAHARNSGVEGLYDDVAAQMAKDLADMYGLDLCEYNENGELDYSKDFTALLKQIVKDNQKVFDSSVQFKNTSVNEDSSAEEILSAMIYMTCDGYTKDDNLSLRAFTPPAK